MGGGGGLEGPPHLGHQPPSLVKPHPHPLPLPFFITPPLPLFFFFFFFGGGGGGGHDRLAGWLAGGRAGERAD
jgi:hypothetical protein